MSTDEESSAPREQVEKAVLAQAVRQWDAGVDAANRLTGRSNALPALIVAVLGYGISQVDSLDAVEPWMYLFLGS